MQQRAAGTKKTALFDIVNRNETPIGIGVEPTGKRVRAPLLSCPGQVQRARLRERNETAISGLPEIGV